MRVTLDHHYPGADPRQLWDIVTSLEALHIVCAPLLVFTESLLKTRIQTDGRSEPRVRRLAQGQQP